jgi:glycosyltransferase involved in cell wall biosynthesis
MKTSIIIIAHNEEKYIEKCIFSILNQTRKADEIILIAHNCTDRTIEIARNFPITIIPFIGDAGIVNARIEGLNHIQGDIILCIDADSFAKNNWVETMIKTLQMNNNILVGSWVKFKGNAFGKLSNIFNKYFCVSKNEKATIWIWGPSLAFWGKDKDLVQEIFHKSIILSEKLKLSRVVDDYWLALFMNKKGNTQVINTTNVTVQTKETSTQKAILRNIENHRNGCKIKNYFNKNN